MEEAPLVGLDGKERRPSRKFLHTVTLCRYLPDNEKLVNNNGVLCSRYSQTRDADLTLPRFILASNRSRAQ